jgi:hypothetical protein
MKHGIIARATASLALAATLTLAAPTVARAAAQPARRAPAAAAALEDGRSWAESLWHRLVDLVLGGGTPARRPAAAGQHGVVTAGQGTADTADGSGTGADNGATINPDG